MMLIAITRLYTGQRPSSIKTRIKTRITYKPLINLYAVRDHLPLKQGLRLRKSFCDHNCKYLVRDHLPLKQGLRLCGLRYLLSLWYWVRDHLPLKQGLRLEWVITRKRVLGQRPSSIKTRIKTW